MVGETFCCKCQKLNNLQEIAEALEEVKQTFHAPKAKYEAGHL